MRFTLTIYCDNAAFSESGNEPIADEAAPEVARLLKKAALYLERKSFSLSLPNVLLDGNGNTVGAFVFSEED